MIFLKEIQKALKILFNSLKKKALVIVIQLNNRLTLYYYYSYSRKSENFSKIIIVNKSFVNNINIIDKKKLDALSSQIKEKHLIISCFFFQSVFIIKLLERCI